MKGAQHGSDWVSSLSEAFHHICVAVCTPAMQNPHSELLLLLCIQLCVLLPRPPQLLLLVLLIMQLQKIERVQVTSQRIEDVDGDVSLLLFY